jgi:hypothetical protein
MNLASTLWRFGQPGLAAVFRNAAWGTTAG